MKCTLCDGRGDLGRYDPYWPGWKELDPEHDPDSDPGVSVCDACEGTGRVGLRERLRQWWVGVEIGVIEPLSFSGPGRLWWRFVTLPRKARRLARDKTLLELHALCGHRQARLDTLIMLAERSMLIPQRHIDAERRLVREAELACDIASARNSTQPAPST